MRLDNFNRECKRAGLDTQTKIAVALRLDRTTLYRTVTSRAASTDFIVGALYTFPACRFADLFELSPQ